MHVQQLFFLSGGQEMTAALNFIIGRAGTGKSTACREAICARLGEEPAGKALVLLLPEHETYKAERELAAAAPGGGFLRAYVFGFRRFARQVLLETGGEGLPRISEVGRQLLLRKILNRRARAGELTVFARAARQRGFTESLADIIKEAKSYRLTPEILRCAAKSLGKGRLSGKLSELALLSEDFQAEMEGRVNDSEDMMELLAQRIPEAEFLRGAEIWVDGFIFFNPQELRVLGALMQTAAAVHVALPLAGEQTGKGVNLSLPENTDDSGLFNRSLRTKAALEQLWHRLGGQGQAALQMLSENRRAAGKPALVALEEQLFSYKPAVPWAGQAGLRLTEAANRRLEVECAAADILRLARSGWRWQEIGVLVRDDEAYGGLLRLVFQDYGIPYFYDGKRPGIHHPLAELLCSSLEAVQGRGRGWRYETMLRVLRTGFFPCVREDVDKLENYVLEFGIRGRSRWTQEEPWHWHRRFSLSGEERADQAQQEYLAEIDGLRRQAAEPLAKLDEALRKAGTVRGLTEALYDYLVGLGVPERLMELAETAEREGRLADGAEHKQIWTSCMALFDQLVEISGDEQLSLQDYTEVLAAGLDALQVSLIPPGLDYVTIAPFDQNSLAGMRGIYILGANAGSMPRHVHGQGLLTDADRMHIAETLARLDEGGGYEISRGGQDRSFGERFLLYRGFNEASEYLWVSWALADSKGEALQPAALVSRLQAIFPKAETLSIPLETLVRKDNLVLSAPLPALSGLVNALRGRKEEGSMQPFWQDVYNWALGEEQLRDALKLSLSGLFAKASNEGLPPELARKLFLRGRTLRGSVTQFEQFRRCPFAHFATYGLKLQERREYHFRSLDLGQLLHEVLREYGQMVNSDYGSQWAAVPPQRRREICGELLEKISPRLQSEILLSRSGYRHLRERLQATALRAIEHLTAWAELSRFRPAFFEEHFGAQGDAVHLKPLPLQGGFSLSFKGQIDRIDVQTDAPYYLVVDYKTGQAAVNIFEVYYGLRLQLLVYLLVARELLKQQGETRLPAGMLYAFLKNPLIKAGSRLSEDELAGQVERELRLPGWVIADPEIIEALERGAAGRFVMPKAKLQTDKQTGEESVSFVPKDSVKEPEEFELLLDYVGYILQDTGSRILAGEIAAHPVRQQGKTGPCGYCLYADVCGFDPQLPGCRYNDLEMAEDLELEEEMAARTGREDLLRAIKEKKG